MLGWGLVRKDTDMVFVYMVHLTNGKSVRVETAGDPTDHPAFFDRVVSVETLGEAGLHLV